MIISFRIISSNRKITNPGAWFKIEPMTGKLIQVTSQLDHKQFNKFIITIKVFDLTVQSKSFVKDFILEIVSAIVLIISLYDR